MENLFEKSSIKTLKYLHVRNNNKVNNTGNSKIRSIVLKLIKGFTFFFTETVLFLSLLKPVKKKTVRLKILKITVYEK